MKIHHVVTEDGSEYSARSVVQLPDSIDAKIFSEEWSTCHLSLAAIIQKGDIYGLQSEITKKIMVPKNYHRYKTEAPDCEESDEESSNTKVLSTQSMRAHSNLICIVEKDDQRCFLVLPSKTSRKSEIVPRKHIEEI